MIRYDPTGNRWISGKNPDDQGMPTTNLTGDTEVCLCVEDCHPAFCQELGENFTEVQAIYESNAH